MEPNQWFSLYLWVDLSKSYSTKCCLKKMDTEYMSIGTDCIITQIPWHSGQTLSWRFQKNLGHRHHGSSRYQHLPKHSHLGSAGVSQKPWLKSFQSWSLQSWPETNPKTHHYKPPDFNTHYRKHQFNEK